MPGRLRLRQKPSDSPAAIGLTSQRALDAPINEFATNLPVDFAEWLPTVVDASPIEEIILFGSRARGDHRPDSDIDLLIVTTRPHAGPDFRAFYRKVRRAVEDFELDHRPVTIGWPLMIIHRSRIRRQLEEGGIELFQALSQGIQVYPQAGSRSLHQCDLTTFNHRRAAAHCLALAREFVLDADNGCLRLPRSHPLAEASAKRQPTVAFSAHAARSAIKAAMWSGMFSLGMHPGTYSVAFMATTLGWPVSDLLDDRPNAEMGPLMTAAREYVERAAAPLSGMKLPRLTYAERSRAEARLTNYRAPS